MLESQSMENYINFLIPFLVILLAASQFLLARHQIKKGAPDGKILLKINIISLLVWTPVTILRFVTDFLAVKIIWFIITAIYMLFTIWYTNELNKSMKR